MKKLLFFVIAAFVMDGAIAQERKRASPRVSTESDALKVDYGSPFKKGREIFGKLVPFGEVWRVGADEATEITFKKDVNFGGADVKAGTYSMFVIPNAGSWDIMLNSELKQWGAYGYEKIKAKNVATIQVNATAAPTEMEQLVITATSGKLTIGWDKTMVEIPVK